MSARPNHHCDLGLLSNAGKYCRICGWVIHHSSLLVHGFNLFCESCGHNFTPDAHLLSYRRAIERHQTHPAKLCLVFLHLDDAGNLLLQPGHSSEVSFARADSLARLLTFVDGGSLPLGCS
jgi:hypothetical protein